MSFGKYLSPHRDEVLAAMKYARSKDVLLVMPPATTASMSMSVRYFRLAGTRKDAVWKTRSSWGPRRPTDGSLLSATTERKMWICSPPEKMYDRPLPRADTIRRRERVSLRPIVSGVAAVLRSFYPDLSAREIREILIRTVTHFPADEMPVPGKSETSRMIQGRQVCLGGGILNAQAAMKEASKISKFGER